MLLGAITSDAQQHHHLALGPLHHEVDVDLGDAVERLSSTSRTARWEASTHPDHFPTFLGEIVVERDDDGVALLRVRGVYSVPFGTVGRFGDGVAGRHVARRCIAGFVGDLAASVDRAAEPLVELDERQRYEVRVVDRPAAASDLVGDVLEVSS